MATVSQNRTLTIKEASKAITRCIAKKRPLMLWGPPGLGKSDIVAQLCAKYNGILYDLRLPLLEPTDLRGMPFFNKEIGKMDWAPPVDLPDEETAKLYPIVFLFLDELNGATPSVQAAAYQLILNRRIGKYRLPDNVVIVAAGNRESDKGVTYRMPAPLANRFAHVEVRSDFDCWHEWAVLNRIHKDVIGYLSFAKADLYDFDPRSPARSFATGRSWSFVSELLDDTAPESEMVDLISGCVGEGLAIKFMAHRKHSASMPQPGAILDGTVEKLETKEISAMYSLVTALCYELQEMNKKLGPKESAKWHTAADNFFKFMLNNFSTEVSVMGCRTAMTIYDLPFVPGKMKSFDQFYSKYGKYILQAAG